MSMKLFRVEHKQSIGNGTVRCMVIAESAERALALAVAAYSTNTRHDGILVVADWPEYASPEHLEVIEECPDTSVEWTSGVSDD